MVKVLACWAHMDSNMFIYLTTGKIHLLDLPTCPNQNKKLHRFKGPLWVPQLQPYIWLQKSYTSLGTFTYKHNVCVEIGFYFFGETKILTFRNSNIVLELTAVQHDILNCAYSHILTNTKTELTEHLEKSLQIRCLVYIPISIIFFL